MYIVLLKHFVTKALKIKPSLKWNIKFPCVATCPLVTIPLSHDVILYLIKILIASSLIYIHSTWLLDGKTSTCFHGTLANFQEN